MDVREIEQEVINGRTKGMPPGMRPTRLCDIGAQGWNVLKEDLPLPLAVLKQSALERNEKYMKSFLAASGSSFAPHGKTTMSPQLFSRQLADGAWAITVATVQQLKIARDFGCERIVLANQLVGRQAIRYVLDSLKSDPMLELYCLVDSIENVASIAAAAAEIRPGRPLRVLLEGGVAGGRTGCRDLGSALAVARAVKAAEPYLALSGVEGFEGLLQASPTRTAADAVRDFLEFLIAIANACDAEKLFAAGEVVLSAGGSAYYDIVVDRLAGARLRGPVRVVTRSGCYLTHDVKLYDDFFEEIRGRNPGSGFLGGSRPAPALEVWAYVQSRPEPEKAILTVGKRDISFDSHLPIPLTWARPRGKTQPLPVDYEVTGINDQHCHLAIPARSPLIVGDMVSLGISHPCTTFDKWQVLCLVDDDYDVIGAIRTFF